MNRRLAVTLVIAILLAACAEPDVAPPRTPDAPALTPVPTLQPPTPGPGGWTLANFAPAAGLAMPSAIARLGDGYLAVGGLECGWWTASAPAGEGVDAVLASTWTPNPWATPRPPQTCLGGAWWSPDGREWRDLTRELAIVLGTDEWPVGGPDPGLRDVAVAGSRVVLIGRDRDGAMAWWGDPTAGFQPAANREVFARSGLAAVAATPFGFVAVGDASVATGPRAAIWTSPDGSSWTRVPDAPVFDVGVATPVGMEGEQIAGGIADVAPGGPGVVAVGRTCDEQAACTAATWWSQDGATWSRGSAAPAAAGLVSLTAGTSVIVAAGGGSLVRSSDGETWTAVALPDAVGPFDRLAASPTGFVALKASRVEGSTDPVPRLWSSVDGVSWQAVPDVPVTGAAGPTLWGADLVATPTLVLVGWEPDNAFAITGPSLPSPGAG